MISLHSLPTLMLFLLRFPSTKSSLLQVHLADNFQANELPRPGKTPKMAGFSAFSWELLIGSIIRWLEFYTYYVDNIVCHI